MSQQNEVKGGDQKKAGTQTGQDQIGRDHQTDPANKSTSDRPDNEKGSGGGQGNKSSNSTTSPRDTRTGSQSTDDNADDERYERLSDADRQRHGGKGSGDRDRQGG